MSCCLKMNPGPIGCTRRVHMIQPSCVTSKDLIHHSACTPRRPDCSARKLFVLKTPKHSDHSHHQDAFYTYKTLKMLLGIYCTCILPRGAVEVPGSALAGRQSFGVEGSRHMSALKCASENDQILRWTTKSH